MNTDDTAPLPKVTRLAEHRQSLAAQEDSVYVVEDSGDSDNPYRSAKRLMTRTEAPEMFEAAINFARMLNKDSRDLQELDRQVAILAKDRERLVTNIRTTLQQLRVLASTYDLSSVLTEELQEILESGLPALPDNSQATR